MVGRLVPICVVIGTGCLFPSYGTSVNHAERLDCRRFSAMHPVSDAPQSTMFTLAVCKTHLLESEKNGGGNGVDSERLVH